MVKRKAFFIVLAFVIMSPVLTMAAGSEVEHINYDVEGNLFYSNLQTFRDSIFNEDFNRELYNVSSGMALGYEKSTRSLKEVDVTAVLKKVESASKMPLDKENMIVSSRFGYRNDPFGVGTIDRNIGGHLDPNRAVAFHSGIDIAAANILGKNIYNFVEGTVKLVQRSNSGYGNLVIIDSGEFETFYAHLHTIDPNLKVGDFVEMGQIIGAVGSTGRSTGPHLHIEIVVDGIAINPQIVLHDCICREFEKENLIVEKVEVKEENKEIEEFIESEENVEKITEFVAEEVESVSGTEPIVFEVGQDVINYNIFDFVAE